MGLGWELVEMRWVAVVAAVAFSIRVRLWDSGVCEEIDSEVRG